MQALASYAEQAEDKELETKCTRVRARAVRRCGELLKKIVLRFYRAGTNPFDRMPIYDGKPPATGKTNRNVRINSSGAGS